MTDIIIQPKDWNIDGTKYKPGDRLILKGPLRAEIEFHNLVGTAEKPIVITATEKLLIKSITPGGRIVNFLNCSFVRFTGTDNNLIEITGAGAMGVDFRELSTNVEADHLYIHDIGYSALNAKTEPTSDPKTWRGNFTLRDVYFHDNVVENIGGEGAYVGLSHAHTAVKEHEVIGVLIINNRFKNIGCDGIQIGACKSGCEISGNTVEGAGLAGRGIDASGIQINPGTNAEVFNNVIIGCKIGFGIYCGGRGASNIHDNLIMNCGNPKAGGGILMANYDPIDPAGFKVVNNTLINIERRGIEAYMEVGGDNILDKNIIYMLNGVHVYRNGPKTKLKDIDNLKLSLLYDTLNLDANYYPTLTSQFMYGRKKPVPPVVITKESAELEVVTTNGVDEIFAVTPTRRIKMK